MSDCFNCKNNCCSKNFIGLVNSFKNDDSNLFNQILLNEEERQRIIKGGGKKYIEKINDKYYMALNEDRSCKAFKDNKCLIYKDRPDVCRLYPFYFDPFGGMFVDKNCSCLSDNLSMDKEEMYQLFANRLKLFEKIEGKNHIEQRMNKEESEELSKKTVFNLIKKLDYASEKENCLYINDINLMELVKKYDTPIAIAFVDIIRKRINYLNDLFKKEIEKQKINGEYNYAYATKANYFAEVVYTASKNLKMLEVSSEYDSELIIELIKIKKLKNKTIICNGFKTEHYVENILKLIKLGMKVIYIINTPSEYELIKDKNINNLEIGLRYDCERESRLSKDNFDNFDIDKSRFGMEKDQLIKIAKKIKEDGLFNISTFHFHFGGKINNIERYLTAIEEVLKVFIQVKNTCGGLINFDIGGGFPTLFNVDAETIIDKLVKGICEVVGRYQRQYNISFNLIGEHGRYTVAEHGIYIFKIEKIIKKNNINWFIINNSLMSYLPDLWAKQEDFIVLPVNNLDKPFIKGKLSGNTCDEDDVFFTNNKNKTYLFPDSNNQYIAILGIGAYQEMISGLSGYSHCMIPKANELIIKSDNKEVFIKAQVKKRETLKRLSYTKRFLNRF